MKLKIGQTIHWQDDYGKGTPYEAKIAKIMIASVVGQENEYESEELDMVDTEWAHLQGREVILITDNEKWLFAWQIQEERELPIKDELCSHCKIPLPVRFKGTGWEYIDGKPLCSGCQQLVQTFKHDEEKEN